jgi:hypothetical protein
LVADVDRRNERRSIQFIEFVLAAVKQNVNALWWIVANLQRFGFEVFQLHCCMDIHRSVLTGHYKPEHERDSQ